MFTSVLCNCNFNEHFDNHFFLFFPLIVTYITLANITTPLCSREHLCRHIGCGNSSYQDSGRKNCHCDPACTFFDDCCVDYEKTCSHREDDVYTNWLDAQEVEHPLKCVNLDGDRAYWMVSECGKDLGEVRDRCANPLCNDTMSRIPVIGPNGILYRNVYCAVCHGLQTTQLTPWQATLTCDEDVVELLGQPEFDTYHLCLNCSLFTDPPALPTSSMSRTTYHLPQRVCVPDTLSSCDHGDNDVCNKYTALMKYDDDIYRNPHCLACRKNLMNPSDWSINCRPYQMPTVDIESASSSYDLSTQSMFSDIIIGISVEHVFLGAPLEPIGVPLSVVMDFGSENTGSSLKISHVEGIVAEKIVTCPEGQVYLERSSGGGKCMQLSCPEGFDLTDGQCVPDLSRMKSNCESDEFGNTMILKALLDVSSTTTCQNHSFQTASSILVSSFINDILSSKGVNIERSTTCDDQDDNVLAITYVIINNEPALYNNIQKTLRENRSDIYNDIRQIEITKGCSRPDGMEYACADSDWLSDNEYVVKTQNETILVYVNSTDTWYATHELLFRVRFDRNVSNTPPAYTKNTDVKVLCSSNKLLCPILTINSTYFREIDSNTGTIEYIPDGRTFESAEYIQTLDGQLISVCNFLNQSAVANVTEMVTFFEYSHAQTVVSMIGSVLSLIAIIITFVTYFVFPTLRNSASRLIMSLVVALFIGQFLLMFGGGRTENPDACVSVAVLAHYAWLSAFAWMNALAFDLDRTFGNPGNLQAITSNSTKKLILYMIYGWGSPLLIVIPCIAIHFCQCTTIDFHYGSATNCWISDGTANLLTFGTPAAIFLVVNMLLFGHTVAGIRSTKKATARIHKDQSTLKRTTQELLIYIKVSNG